MSITNPGKLALAAIVTVTACSTLAACGSGSGGTAASGSCLDSIKESKTVTIGNPGYLPIANDDNGDLQGLVPDLLNEANKRAGLDGVKLEGLALDFSSLVPALRSKRIQVSGDTMTPTDERKKQIAFTSNLWYISQDLLVKKGNPKNLHSLEALAGHSATTFEGSTWIPQLEAVKGVEIRPLKTSSAILQAVQSGQVDAGLIDSVAVAWAMKMNPNLGIEAATDYESPDGKTPTALGIAPDCTDYAKALDKAFDEMKVDGAYQKLMVRWGLEPAAKWLEQSS